jgi:hypothetical protein
MTDLVHGFRNPSTNHFYFPAEAKPVTYQTVQCFRYPIIVAHFSLAVETIATL